MQELTMNELDLISGGKFTGTASGMLKAFGLGALGGALRGARTGNIYAVLGSAVFYGAIAAAGYTIMNCRC